MIYQYLKKIESPAQVKELSIAQCNVLCSEIRDCMIHTVAKNGGHLASSLGTVELTVALHRVFNSPNDAILFDVGHQSYTHKLLTGRYSRFSTLRKEGGLGGFMRPDESVHDPFITGHSSNSISAAYGIYKAKCIKGEDGTAIAVIGDGAMTGGLAFEALNNAGNEKSKFIVILNDNKMSISRNVGAMARYLNRIRSRVGYHSFKRRLDHFLSAIPFIGKPLRDRVISSKIMLKNAIYHSNIFEGLGFQYFGPVDGHNIEAVENILRIAKNQNHPALIHVVTVKGKGYSFAETEPNCFHGVSGFDVLTGNRPEEKTTYSDVAGRTLCQLADVDQRVCAVTAAMKLGTGLSDFARLYKNRFFDVGIAEEHAVTFSSGLAKDGMRPYFVVYSSFLQRGYDQVLHDAAIGGFSLRLCIDRAGIVGEDGETHQGLFDVSYLSSVPGVTIYSPASFDELHYTILHTVDVPGVVAIRYPRGGEKSFSRFSYTGRDFDVFFKSNDRLILTYGRLSFDAYTAAETCGDVTFLKLNRIFPLSEELIEAVMKFRKIYFFEESERSGSIGEKLFARLCEKGYKGIARHFAVDNEFVPAATVASSLHKRNLDEVSMLAVLRGEN